jgi:hypothetical protein
MHCQEDIVAAKTKKQKSTIEEKPLLLHFYTSTLLHMTRVPKEAVEKGV